MCTVSLAKRESAMNDIPNPARRAFLRGRASPESPVTAPDAAHQRIARLGLSCLALANVVCRSCGDVCETAAIRFRPRLGAAAQPEVDHARCNGCGDCLPACPSTAITLVPATNPAIEGAASRRWQDGELREAQP